MKNDLMFGILLSLLKNGKSNATELAKKFEVSTKTIYRYLSYLDSAGVPTFSTNGKNGGTEILNSFSLSKSYFNKKEIARILSIMNTTPLKELETINNQIVEKLSLIDTKNIGENDELISQIIIDPKPWGKPQKTTELEKKLLKNISDKKVLKFVYSRYKKTEVRIISPYSLVLKNGSYYLVGKCKARNDLRTFKLTRITNIEVVDEEFENNELNPTEMIQRIELNFEKIEIELEVEDAALSDVLEWLDEWKISIRDGKKIVKGTTNYTKGLKTKILSFGEQIRLLSPSLLIEEIKDFCQKFSKIYSQEKCQKS